MKQPKADVDYRRASGEKRCGNCSMYRGPALMRKMLPGSCTLVAGEIDADDTCDEWRRAKG